jgi:hypothetical protein
MILAALAWVLPVVLSNDAAVTHTTRLTKDGSTKVESESIGWASIRSDALVGILFGGGLVLLVLGVIPGPITKIVTPFGTLEFEGQVLAEVAGRTVTKVAGGQAVPVKEFEEVFSETVDNLSSALPGERTRFFRPSKAQMDEAVERALEKRG